MSCSLHALPIQASSASSAPVLARPPQERRFTVGGSAPPGDLRRHGYEGHAEDLATRLDTVRVATAVLTRSRRHLLAEILPTSSAAVECEHFIEWACGMAVVRGPMAWRLRWSAFG